MLEKSIERIVDGEKDKHIDHRKHQTGMDTGVKGDKATLDGGDSRSLEGWKMTGD